MPAWPSTVAGNTITQQRQIDKQGTARLGPVSIGPGDGHFRVHDGATDLMLLDPSGIQLNVHGAMRSLPAIIESKASTTYVDGNVATLRARDDEQQIDIDRRATKTYVDGNVTTIVGRLNGIDTRLDGLDAAVAARATKSYVDGNVTTLSGRITTAQSRADSAYSRADAAYNRADDAHAIAVDALNKVTALRAQTRNWMLEARSTNPDLPPAIPA